MGELEKRIVGVGFARGRPLTELLLPEAVPERMPLRVGW